MMVKRTETERREGLKIWAAGGLGGDETGVLW